MGSSDVAVQHKVSRVAEIAINYATLDLLTTTLKGGMVVGGGHSLPRHSNSSSSEHAKADKMSALTGEKPSPNLERRFQPRRFQTEKGRHQPGRQGQRSVYASGKTPTDDRGTEKESGKEERARQFFFEYPALHFVDCLAPDRVEECEVCHVDQRGAGMRVRWHPAVGNSAPF